MDTTRRRKMMALGDVIGQSLDHGYLGLARELVRVFDVWESAVGSFNAARTMPESIQGGVLTVLVESPAWIDRLSYFRKEFTDKINTALGAPMVEEILFKVGSLPSAPADSAPHDPSLPPPPPAEPLSPELASALDQVTDPQLKDELARWLTRSPSGGSGTGSNRTS
jgi:hypothetical protein